MLENILDYERELFLALNGSHSVYWDGFMWLYSGKLVWLPLAAFIFFILTYKKKWQDSLLILLAIVLLIVLCDQFASTVCKPLFSRFRPTHHPDFMYQVKIVFGYRGGKYGFISSHAANAFGFATFMTLLFRHKLFLFTIFFWAALTAYSRIYLGVHFISDIIPGALAGLFFGYAVYQLYRYVRMRLYGPADYGFQLYSSKEILWIVGAIYSTILCILLFSKPLILCLSKENML